MPVNVTRVEAIEPQPRDADQRRWRVSIDDGTIPASVEVYMSGSEATAMGARHDEAEWIAQQVKRRAPSAPDAATQLQQLRLEAPLELRWIT